MAKGPQAPDPYATAAAQGNENRATSAWNAVANNPNVYSPYGSSVFSQEGWQAVRGPNGEMTMAPRYRQDITLSPGEEALRLKNEQLRGSLSDTALNQAGRIGKLLSTEMNTTGLSPWQTYNKADPLRRDEAPTDRASIENAAMRLYDRQTDPRNRAQEAQAVNRGLTVGGQGYGQMLKGQSDARTDAIDKAFLLSGDESRAAQAAYNDAVMNKYQMGTDWADRMNTLRQNQYVERTSLRDQPIKEIMTLLGHTGPNTPTFTPFNTSGVGVNPANITDMIYNKYAADKQGYNNNLSGIFGLASSVAGALPWASFLSDRRLKESIRRAVGELAGVPLYSFRFRKHGIVPKALWGCRRLGVMADEVRLIHPDAVRRERDGYDRVNYELLNERHCHG
jgi:hypothetical protein